MAAMPRSQSAPVCPQISVAAGWRAANAAKSSGVDSPGKLPPIFSHVCWNTTAFSSVDAIAAARAAGATRPSRFYTRYGNPTVQAFEEAVASLEGTEAALAFVKGKRVEDVVGLGEEIFDELMARKLWPGTLALAQGHLDRGQRVWLVTATPVELASIIAERLGLTGALGTVSEIEDGVYTGRLVGAPLHGKAKAEAVRALAEREGLELIRCTAYSDSANDVPMLSLVGRAVAVNPDAALRSHARAVGWEIHDYRRARFATHYYIPAGLAAAAGVGVGIGIGIGAARVRKNGWPTL